MAVGLREILIQVFMRAGFALHELLDLFEEDSWGAEVRQEFVGVLRAIAGVVLASIERGDPANPQTLRRDVSYVRNLLTLEPFPTRDQLPNDPLNRPIPENITKIVAQIAAQEGRDLRRKEREAKRGGRRGRPRKDKSGGRGRSKKSGDSGRSKEVGGSASPTTCVRSEEEERQEREEEE